MALLQIDSTLGRRSRLAGLGPGAGALSDVFLTSAPFRDALALWPRLCPAEVSDSLRTHEDVVAKTCETHFLPLNIPIHPLRPDLPCSS